MGRRILYPLRILVTFLHELGHALGAIVTGGAVDKIQINADGSGWTRSAGGHRAITIMGGYLGSALFGNLIFFIGARIKTLVNPFLYLLGLVMIFTAVFWFNSLFTSGVLILFALSMFMIASKTKWGSEVLMFFGLASIVYIIQDFRVGPSSDLEAYAKELVIFPPQVWMYVWLLIVLLIFAFNLKILLSSKSKTNYSYGGS